MPEEDYYIGSRNQNKIDDNAQIIKTVVDTETHDEIDDNVLRKKTDVDTESHHEDENDANAQIIKKDMESSGSVSDEASEEINIKGNRKRAHKKNRPTGNAHNYKDSHAYQNYDDNNERIISPECFLKKTGKLSLQTIFFDNESSLEKSQIDTIRHTTYGKNVDADQKNQNSSGLLQSKLSFQLQDMNEKQNKITGAMKSELLAKYILENYPNEKSFKFQVIFFL